MPLEGLCRKLFEELKYKHDFPPRKAAGRIKSECAMRGLGRSGALVTQVAELYLESVKRLLDEFAREVTAKSQALGLRNGVEVRDAVSTALQEIFNLAGGALRQELQGQGDGVQLGLDILEQRGAVWEHLDRMIGLLETEQKAKPPNAVEKEREQKFGILLSPGQAVRDFDALMAESRRLGIPIAVLFVDLDHFKALNERWTEATVDRTVLPETQRLLARLVHGRGEAYRHGGEEFVLLMANLDMSEAQAFAEKIRAAFEAARFDVDSETVQVKVSVGVALWPAHGATYQEVLQAANHAKAKAKESRNTVRVYEVG